MDYLCSHFTVSVNLVSKDIFVFVNQKTQEPYILHPTFASQTSLHISSFVSFLGDTDLFLGTWASNMVALLNPGCYCSFY